MRRRAFIRGIAAFAASPCAAHAQQRSGKIPQIGWLAVGSPAAQTLLDEYRSGMRELGYIEGRTVQTEYLYADGQIDRLPGLAAELVGHNVDVIVTAGTPGSLAAKRATISTYQSCLPRAATRSPPASFQACRAPEETSPGCRSWRLTSARSDSNSSTR